MARAPVQRLAITEQLQPVASPVDTYVKPARSPLLDIAQSLGEFDANLQQFVSQRDKKREEEDALRGRAKFLGDKGSEFATLVDSGKVPAQYSPFFVQGYQQARGEQLATTMRSDWQVFWDNWAGKDSEDPQAFDKAFQEFIRTKVTEGTNPDILRGLLPGVEALQANATTQYIQYRHDKLVDDNLAVNSANGLGAVQRGLDAGSVEPDGANYPQVFDTFNAHFSSATQNGDPGGKAETVFVDAMAAKIIETADPELLKWFDTKVPGKDYTWKQSVHGIEVYNQTAGVLESKANSQRTKMDAAATEEQKRLKAEAESSLIDNLIKDPRAAFDDKLVEQAKKNGNPRILIDLQNWRDSVLKAQPSDPTAIQGYYSKVISGEMSPQDALKEAMSHGVFKNPSDLTAAATFAQNFKTRQSVIEETMGSSQYKSYLEAMRVRTQGVNSLLDPIAGVSNEGFEAQSDFRQLVARYLLDNQNATPQDIANEVDRIGKQVLGSIQMSQDPTSPGTYDRPADLPFPNPAQDQQQSQPVDPNQDIRQWEQTNEVTPEDKAALTQKAEQSGMSYEEFIRSQIGGKASQLQNQQQQAPQNDQPQMFAPDGTPIEPMSFNPAADQGGEDRPLTPVTPQQAEQWLDEAFTTGAPSMDAASGDVQIEGLGAVVRRGEANGNYNAVFGNAKSTVDLGQYTIDDILGFQQEARKAGAKSTAVGAYQFIWKTLNGLKQEMGLTGSEKFTPELQDKMFVRLLYRRGLQDFREGRISKKTFALSLSQEWAALPNPHTGLSYYAGDGLNKARVKTSKVYEALGLPVSLGAPQQQATPAADPYANIPDTDGSGNVGQKDKFRQWNPDPVGNNEANLAKIDPTLAEVYRKAQSYLPFQIVVGAGKRDAAQQQKAIKWGWSKTSKSDHLDGSAADIWAIDPNGAVTFDSDMQKQVVEAMKRAAADLGVTLDVGAEWKGFRDPPHFGIKNTGA